MSSFISHIDWRFATKAFDTTKKVSDTDIATLKSIIQKSPSSFGIQPYHIIEVTDPALRQKIRQAGWDQPQITDASHLFVFCARTDVISRIDAYVEVASNGSPEAKVALQGYADMMHGSIDGRSATEVLDWTGRQTYIALGFALAACAELTLDSCPMEGFDTAAVRSILQTPDHIVPLALLPVGYRAMEPERPKVRFSSDDLFSTK